MNKNVSQNQASKIINYVIPLRPLDAVVSSFENQTTSKPNKVEKTDDNYNTDEEKQIEALGPHKSLFYRDKAKKSPSVKFAIDSERLQNMIPYKRERKAPDMGPFMNTDDDLNKAIYMSLSASQNDKKCA